MLPKYKDIVELLKKGSTLEAQEQVMTLREGALELQEENQELKSKVRELEEKLKVKGDWDKQKSRYQLVNPWRGPAQTYALKKANSDGEEPHLVCATCFNNEQRVILNPIKNKDRWIQMVCPKCNSTMDTGYKGIGGPKYAEEYEKES